MEQPSSSNTINSSHLRIRIETPILLAVLSLGISTIITQIILVREFLSVFYGNELVIGVILTNWLVLTGAGAFLGNHAGLIKNRMNFMIITLLFMAVLPVATVFLLGWLRNIVFPAGSMPGLIQILYSSFILLLPYCMLSGFLFTFFAHTISEKYGANLISSVYSAEALGSVAGGLGFNLVMIYFLKTFQVLTVLMLINAAVSLTLSVMHGSRAMKVIVLPVSLLALSVPLLFDLDAITKRFLFKDQEVIFFKDTPYGSLTVTRQADQNNYYENNVLLFSSNEIDQNEEAVHYAMIQHPNPGSVLLISGGISGTTDEILKYPVSRIDYVEINPYLIALGKQYTTALADRRITVINKDARIFIKEAKTLYDVALINVSDPTTAQLNRYYTAEFMQDLKKRLNKGAVISLGLLASADYWGEEALQITSVTYNTLKQNFRNVVIIPGMKNYFLASDSDLDSHITEMIERKGIENLYVNRYYLDDRILLQRSGELMGNLDRAAGLNSDFNPVSYYRQLLYWLSYFRVDYRILPGIVLAVLFIAVRKFNAISFGMFAGGFAATSVEVILLLAFQVIYGYVYQITGLIITVFMAGLATGSLYGQRIQGRPDYKHYIMLQVGIGAFAVVLPFILMALKSGALHHVIIHFVFFALAFIIALLVGMEFSLASRLRSGVFASVSSELYGVELMGSAIGALIVTTYLIPLLGIIKVCFIIASLSMAGGFITYAGRKKIVLSV